MQMFSAKIRNFSCIQKSILKENNYLTALSGKARPLQKEPNGGREHGESDAASEDQRALQKSEEMMKAFLTATGGEEDELNKSERTRTIIKTIKVRICA